MQFLLIDSSFFTLEEINGSLRLEPQLWLLSSVSLDIIQPRQKFCIVVHYLSFQTLVEEIEIEVSMIKLLVITVLASRDRSSFRDNHI